MNLLDTLTRELHAVSKGYRPTRIRITNLSTPKRWRLAEWLYTVDVKVDLGDGGQVVEFDLPARILVSDFVEILDSIGACLVDTGEGNHIIDGGL